MAKELCVATIQVVLNTDNPDVACDAVSNILNDAFPDIYHWEYLRNGLTYSYPVRQVFSDEFPEEA